MNNDEIKKIFEYKNFLDVKFYEWIEKADGFSEHVKDGIDQRTLFLMQLAWLRATVEADERNKTNG